MVICVVHIVCIICISLLNNFGIIDFWINIGGKKNLDTHDANDFECFTVLGTKIECRQAMSQP